MRLLLLLYCLASTHILYTYQQAIVLKPCIDVVAYPLAGTGLTYESLSYAVSNKTPYDACPRIHQLLYNEVVEILQEKGNEVYIRVPHVFYIASDIKKPQSCFWTQKDNIVPLHKIDKHIQAYIPPIIDYRKKGKELDQPSIIALSRPWHSTLCDCTFSAGTRFVCKNLTRGTHLIAYAIHPHTKQVVELSIPFSHYIMPAYTDQRRAHLIYMKLVKDWTNTQALIPYVWGGCSFVHTACSNDQFKKLPIELSHITGNSYAYDIKSPYGKTGFDCAGLISRAAQSAGFPYYYKNTTTLVHFLKPITQKKEIQEGDLVWIPGHVMIIGDITNHTIIESRHYDHGYGKLHEIPLSQVFKGMHTFNDLHDAIMHHKPLYRLDKNGTMIATIREAKILAIDSCWQIGTYS